MTGAGPRSMRRNNIPQQSDGSADDSGSQQNCLQVDLTACLRIDGVDHRLVAVGHDKRRAVLRNVVSRSAGRRRRYVLPLTADSRLNLYLG